MYIIWFLRWIRSYVRFSVRVGSLERLLNLCSRYAIPVWDCKRSGGDAIGCTTVSGYHRLRPLLRENSIRLRVTGRYGARFIGYRYRKRVGILAGIILFGALLVLSQQFVWQVKVEGCKQLVNEQQLLQLLEQEGVRRGTAKKQIDLFRIARTVEVEVDGVSWAALNLYGTTAILKINERTPPPVKIDTGVPANVVAAQDGQIITLQVTDGKAVLKEGDTVRAGDMIVSGVREDRWGVTHLVRANAKVIAHVPASLSVEVLLEKEQPVSAGRVVRRDYLELLGMRLPLFLYTGLEGSYKMERFTTPLWFGGTQLPISYSRERYIFYDTHKVSLSQQEALKIAQKQLAKLEQKQLAGCKILSRETSAVCENGVLTLRGAYEIEQDIAKQVEIGLLERSKVPKPEREGGY